MFVEGIGDLDRELFLELGSAGVALDESRQLGQSNDAAARRVPHVSFADEGDQVMLADRVQGYIPHEYRIPIVLREADLQVARGVLAQASKEVGIGVGDALRGAEDPLAVRILPYPYEDLAHRPLDAGPVHLVPAWYLLGQRPNPPPGPAAG